MEPGRVDLLRGFQAPGPATPNPLRLRVPSRAPAMAGQAAAKPEPGWAVVMKRAPQSLTV